MPRRRNRDSTDDLITLGIIAGAAAIIGSAIAASSSAKPRLVVGGVDLTNTDLTRPFLVNFSVLASASLQTKQGAFLRLRQALFEFEQRWPSWLLTTKVSIEEGVFQLYVTPVAPNALVPQDTPLKAGVG